MTSSKAVHLPLLVLSAVSCEPAPLEVIWLPPVVSGGSAGTGSPAQAPRFDAPVLIPSLVDPGSDDDPSLTEDLLELYFSSRRNGGEDIWVSKRLAATAEWGEPLPVIELNSELIDATPGISPDGLSIWFESTRGHVDDLAFTDVWTSTRPNREASWSAPVAVAELNTAGRDSAPLPSSSLLMTFSTWRDGGVGDTDIYVTLRASAADAWGAPSPLAEVSSASWDQGLLRADGTQIFISSGREIELRSGNLFWSARTAFGAAFLEPVPLVELNSDDDDEDIWVSHALDYLVFASDRSGNLELYEARGQR